MNVFMSLVAYALGLATAVLAVVAFREQIIERRLDRKEREIYGPLLERMQEQEDALQRYRTRDREQERRQRQEREQERARTWQAVQRVRPTTPPVSTPASRIRLPRIPYPRSGS